MSPGVSQLSTGDGLTRFTYEILRTLSMTFLISAGCCFQLQFLGILYCSLLCVTAMVINTASPCIIILILLASHHSNLCSLFAVLLMQ